MYSWKTAISLALIFSSLLLAENQKISELSAVTQLDKDDLLLVSGDDGDGTYTSKKLTLLAYATVYDVRLYGAKGNGTVDDTTAIQAAMDATPAGGTCYFPSGTYKFTSSLTRTAAQGSIHLRGAGEGTLLFPVIDGSTDAIVLGSTTAGSYQYSIEDMTIYSPSLSLCNNAIVFQRTYFAWLEDVTVICDHQGAALLCKGATGMTLNRFRVGYSSAASGYTRGVTGIRLEDSTVQFNGVKIHDSWVNLVSGNGLEMVSVIGSNNISWDGGGIQEVGSYYIYADNCDLVEFKNIYCEDSIGAEPNLYLKDCSSVTLGPNFKAYASDCEIEAYNVDNLDVLGNSWIRTFDVHPLCERWRFGEMTFTGTPDANGFSDVNDIRFAGPVMHGTVLYHPGRQSFENLFYNADFERWTDADTAAGWSSNLWSKSGDGCTDTTTYITDHCGKITSTTFGAITLTLPDAADIAERLKGKTFSVGMWMRKAAGTWASNAVCPQFRVGIVTPGGTKTTYAAAVTSDDTWEWRSLTLHCDSDATDIQIAVLGASSDASFYVAAPTLTGTWEAQNYTREIHPLGDEDVNNVSADLTAFPTRGLVICNSSGAAISGTVAAGSYIGQRVKFVCKVAGNNIDITVSNHVTSDPETIRLDTATEWVELVWDGTDWVEVSGNGQTYP